MAQVKFKHSFVLTDESWPEPCLMTLENGHAKSVGLESGKLYCQKYGWKISKYCDNLWAMVMSGVKVRDYFSYKYHSWNAPLLTADDFDGVHYLVKQSEMARYDRA